MDGERIEELCACVADALETDGVSVETDYAADPGWSSLCAFALKLMVRRRFGADLPLKTIASCRSVRELAENIP